MPGALSLDLSLILVILHSCIHSSCLFLHPVGCSSVGVPGAIELCEFLDSRGKVPPLSPSLRNTLPHFLSVESKLLYTVSRRPPPSALHHPRRTSLKLHPTLPSVTASCCHGRYVTIQNEIVTSVPLSGKHCPSAAIVTLSCVTVSHETQ